MDQSRLHNFEAQCTQEEPPACQTMCPLHVDVRAVARLMAQGKPAEARKILDRHMPLSGLVGYLCKGVCMPHCKRADVDAPLNLPMLERACLANSRTVKPISLPANGKKAVILGAGLSSLVTAFELAKKGYSTTLLHTDDAPGGRLRVFPAEQLPSGVLDATLEMLRDMRVEFERVDVYSPALLEEAQANGAAVYVGLDDPSILAESMGIACKDGAPVLDPVTLCAGPSLVFAGGWAPAGCVEASCVFEAADGRKAAASIDRILKGVNPASAREKEGQYPSTLYTDMAGVEKIPAVAPASPFAPTVEEAASEASRCIQCECLECVKRCPYLANYKAYPKRYAREIYNNLSIVHGQRKMNTQINACTECGLCAVVCPYDADMGAFCVDAKKYMVRSNRMPPRPHEFALQDMEFSNAPDVGFFRHQPGASKSAFAFFPGCQLPASLPGQTESLYRHLCDNLEGGVGFFLSCCGAPARWTGRPELTAKVAGRIREQWEVAGKPELILACSSCRAFFAAELPDIPVTPLWETLAALPMPANASASAAPLALHDPCVTRVDTRVQQSVRSIAERLGQQIEELELGRERTRCCGYGGLAAFAEPSVGKAYAESRAHDTQHTLLSYCIMCRDRLSLVGAPSLHVLDLLFPLFPTDEGSFEDYLQQAATRPALGISLRQESRLAFRRGLLQKLWGEEPERNPSMENMVLHIADDVAARMEERRILHTDVKTVLLQAEENGGLFFNPATGRTLACLRPRQVTFWVEYKKEEDGGYSIFDAYCHRMVVPGVPGEGAPSPCTLEGYSAKGGRM